MSFLNTGSRVIDSFRLAAIAVMLCGVFCSVAQAQSEKQLDRFAAIEQLPKAAGYIETFCETRFPGDMEGASICSHLMVDHFAPSMEAIKSLEGMTQSQAFEVMRGWIKPPAHQNKI